MEELLRKAEKILDTLKKDADLIPTNLRGWWEEYLINHKERYLESLCLLWKEGIVNKKVLEIGSSPGHFTVLLKKLGVKIEGIDIAPERFSRFWKKHRLEITKTNIEIDSFPFSASSFEVILFMEMIEHLRINPLHVIREINRVLKIGGSLFLSTPNITPLHKIRFLKGKPYQGDPVKEFEKLEKLGHMGHIRLYCFEEIKSFMEYGGFDIIKKKYIVKNKSFHWKENLLQLLYFGNKEAFNRYLWIHSRKTREVHQ